MLAVREDLVLQGQERAAGVDEVDARQPVVQRHLLRAQVLLHRHRVVGAAFDRRVVGDDHALAPLDAADAGDDAGAVDRVLVHAVGGKRRELEERPAGINQRHHALAGQQLAAPNMTVARTRGAAGRGLGALLFELIDQRAHLRGVGFVLAVLLDHRFQD